MGRERGIAAFPHKLKESRTLDRAFVLFVTQKTMAAVMFQGLQFLKVGGGALWVPMTQF